MPYATQTFHHDGRDFKRGDEYDADDPMVALRPDLFSDDPPAKATKPKTEGA